MALRARNSLPIKHLNHISLVCKDLVQSVAFYRDVLGFVEIRRPQSFDFEGSWYAPPTTAFFARSWLEIRLVLARSPSFVQL